MLSGLFLLVSVSFRKLALESLTLLSEIIEVVVPEGIEIGEFLVVLIFELVLLFSVSGLHFIV